MDFNSNLYISESKYIVYIKGIYSTCMELQFISKVVRVNTGSSCTFRKSGSVIESTPRGWYMKPTQLDLY